MSKLNVTIMANIVKTYFVMPVNEHVEQSMQKEKNLCSWFQVFIETFLSNFNLFNMGRILGIKECSLRGFQVQL